MQVFPRAHDHNVPCVQHEGSAAVAAVGILSLEPLGKPMDVHDVAQVEAVANRVDLFQ